MPGPQFTYFLKVHGSQFTEYTTTTFFGERNIPTRDEQMLDIDDHLRERGALSPRRCHNTYPIHQRSSKSNGYAAERNIERSCDDILKLF